MGSIAKENIKHLKPPKSNLPESITKKVKSSSIKSSQASVKQIVKVKKRSFDPIKANRGVVFIKHIPHGFYEEQMRKYFEQFGTVTRLRVARSQRTGRSKGYAFIEFKVPEVAKIASDTMHNYIMFKHMLKTTYIPPQEQKFNYFHANVRYVTDSQGVRKYISPKIQRLQDHLGNINRIKTNEEHANKVERAKYKLKKQQEKYGIDLSSCLYNGNTIHCDEKYSSEETSLSNANKSSIFDFIAPKLNDSYHESRKSDDDNTFSSFSEVTKKSKTKSVVGSRNKRIEKKNCKHISTDILEKADGWSTVTGKQRKLKLGNREMNEEITNCKKSKK